jgi:hypothetical protein
MDAPAPRNLSAKLTGHLEFERPFTREHLPGLLTYLVEKVILDAKSDGCGGRRIVKGGSAAAF